MEEVEFWNPNVLSLAPDAAAYTTEYRWSMITTAGDTVRMQGSWTYVMRRVGDDWTIFHSTGTHVPMKEPHLKTAASPLLGLRWDAPSVDSTASLHVLTQVL